VVSLVHVWGQIEAVVSRAELAAAMAAVEELTPAPDSDDDEAWRVELTKRYAVVRPFLSLLGEVIAFDNAPEGRPVLEALRRLPELAGRQKVRDDEIVAEIVTGSWRRLVYAPPTWSQGPSTVAPTPSACSKPCTGPYGDGTCSLLAPTAGPTLGQAPGWRRMGESQGLDPRQPRADREPRRPSGRAGCHPRSLLSSRGRAPGSAVDGHMRPVFGLNRP